MGKDGLIENMFLLDSDIIIDFLKNREEAILTLNKLVGQKILISMISWIEVTHGIKISANPNKQAKRFEELQKILKTSILPINLKIANCFIDLKISLKNQQLQDFDLFIAATAISNNLTLLTRNTKHFSRIKNLSLYE